MHVFWQLSWHPNSLQSHWLVSKWVGIPLIRLNKAFLWNRVDLVFKVHNGILWKDCCYFCLICSSFETPRKVEMLTCSETCCYAFKIWFYIYFEWHSLTILYFSPGVWEEINLQPYSLQKRHLQKVQIQISWLLKKLSDQDLHFFVSLTHTKKSTFQMKTFTQVKNVGKSRRVIFASDDQFVICCFGLKG